MKEIKILTNKGQNPCKLYNKTMQKFFMMYDNNDIR